MSPFLVSIVVSAALGVAAPHGPASESSDSRRHFGQSSSSSHLIGSVFEQFFKDNSPKSTKDQEAVLLKKEQELLAAEQALLAKERLLLQGSPSTDTTANSSTQSVKSPTLSESQQEAVVTERARLATPQLAPKDDVKALPVKKKEVSSSSQEALSESTKQASVESPVKAVNSPKDTSLTDTTGRQPRENEPTQTKKEATTITEVAPVPSQQSASLEELEALRKRNSALEQELAELRKKLASKERSVGEKDQTASQAVRELNETKARLMLAETQVERLSSIIEARNDCTISQLTGETRQRPIQAATSRLPVVPKVESSAEMPIATVVKKKVYLRTGPGKNNSPLMAVSEGTRLAVETMQGEWYRVITPTGARAWVAAESIAFGNGGKIAPARSTSAPSATEQSEEDKAFELLKRR